jgi:hypothetical protein
MGCALMDEVERKIIAARKHTQEGGYIFFMTIL